MDHHAASFSIINNMRTGNPAADMAIAMIIPSLIASVFAFATSHIKPFFISLANKFFRADNSKQIIRRIEFEQSSSYYSTSKEGRDKRNNILQKALTMYIGEHCGAVKFRNANVSLLAAKEKGNYDNNTWSMQYGSTAEQLKAYTVTTVPPKDEWVDVSDGVKFREAVNTEEEGEENNKVNKKTTLFMFSSDRKDGGDLIDNYIKTAFEWYTKEVGRQVDLARYMYMPIHKEISLGSEENKDDAKQFKRYKLSDRKTFDSLFFPEKDGLMHLFDNFLEKKEKYAIPGYPDKLGLLLFGPPGTGKTSLIKAMASYTKRSIINISLSKIKTNQELMDIFFDQKFSVKDEELPVKMSFSDVIFVMEDVDAASKIVHKRSKGKNKPKSTVVTTTKQIVTGDETADGLPGTLPPIPVAIKDGGVAGGPPVLVREVSTKVVEQTSKVVRTTTESSQANGGDNAVSDDEDDEDEENAMFKAIASALGGGDSEEGDKDAIAVGPKNVFGNKDKLDLAGLLNVLDGVVDTPDRIVIMTTNHPEKLDAALIRPGRIDKKIFLGYLNYESAIKMVHHYFGIQEEDMKKEHCDKLKEVFEEHKKITPAVFEQYCSEHDDIADFATNAMAFFRGQNAKDQKKKC
ncbi:hypothetical protein TrLO_g3572 [Triparma laevis f. longispina]|uniref:AAA+ ATPase domain-containing protein n=1 Tax=Triparma laevis f. longispina TaxID=1714387 RepID=A0A9W6ZBH3_9STRA|nr:hypothetical protein TrLO_g3572 [Triparma laevis f. longispina]